MTEKVLDRLRQGQIKALIGLSFDHILHVPIAQLISPQFMATQITRSIETAVAGEKTQQWLAQQVHAVLALAPEGCLRTHVDNKALQPLMALLGTRFQSIVN